MNKKCLVLGGDTFLGSHLVDDLLLRGFEVRAFDIFEEEKPRNLRYPQERLEIFPGSLLDSSSIDEALENIAYVFHFISSGSPAASIDNPQKDIKESVISTVSLLDACLRHGVQRIIYHSSGGAIYGDVKSGYAKEDQLLSPLTPYSINKLCIEQYLNYYKRHFGLDYIAYRISNPYGERQPLEGISGVISILLRKVLRGETIDIFGNSIRDYIYAKDAAGLIVNSFDKEHKHTIYNLGSGKETSLTDILRIIESVAQVKPKINQLAKREFDVERIVLDISRIQEEFHFAPQVDLTEGVKITFDAIRQMTDNKQ